MPTPEDIRRFAFRHVLLLDRAGEAPGKDETDPHDIADALTPSEREKAFQMARRRLAFQVLFEIDAGGKPGGDLDARIASVLARVEDLGPLDAERIATLVHAAFSAKADADAEFGKLAPEWPAHRQPAVDRAILRLARAEILAGELDHRIVVSEAVELAKAFSTERSPSFVNALLDRVMKRVEEEKKAETERRRDEGRRDGETERRRDGVTE